MDAVLKIGGVPVTELKERYGTPLYVYDEEKLLHQCRQYSQYFSCDAFDTEVLYASKAFSCIEMLRLVKNQGLSVDVVSMGELFTALKAGISPDRIYFHGNNKTLEEIRYALDNHVQKFIVDNLQEAYLLVEEMKTRDYVLHVLLRINPCIEAHTHAYIQTANIDSKFGIHLESISQIVDLIQTLKQSNHIVFDGFHAHIGSQIFEKEAFVKEIETMFSLIDTMQKKGILCNTLNLGGGFAVHYTDEDQPIPISVFSSVILETCQKMQELYHTNIQKILIEPGRSIVAEAGSTLYTVGFIKKTPHKKYVFVDGGMSDNIRPSLYQAKYEADIVNHMDQKKTEIVCVAGKCCESGDILIDSIALSPCDSGDLLMVYSTGAYGFSMFNNYNRNLRPAVVFVKEGNSRLVVKRETLQELVRGDVCDEDPV